MSHLQSLITLLEKILNIIYRARLILVQSARSRQNNLRNRLTTSFKLYAVYIHEIQ